MIRRLLLFLCLSAACAVAQSAEGVEYFEKYVRPVLVERCYACHSQDSPQPMGALLLDTRDGLLAGGNAGPAIEPGAPERSLLLHALSYEDELKMPPGGKLPGDQIARIREWVRMGAPDPRVGAPRAEARLDANHWSFRSPVRPEPPTADGRAAIDRFVRARLAEKGLSPSPPADRRTALRRLYVDLIGLAPTYEQAKAFESDDSPDAWERIVDGLLQSPMFGQRWGRHWLDVARYSDEGFQARPFSAAWTYRDWVIQAFNDDMPYDRFVLRQLAADLLPGDDSRHLAALGFLTVGINLPRPTDVPENLDDRIDVVTRGLLGLSVACARCHDHKYDPIPQKDYYSLYGVFLNSHDVLEPQPIDTVAEAAEAEYYLAKLQKRRKSIDEFKRERLDAHMEEFRSPEALEQYIQAASDGRNLTNTQLEKLSVERNLNLYLLERWRRFLREQSSLAARGAGELAAALAAADRSEPWDDPEKENLRLALRGPDAPTNIPFEDFWWIQNEGDSNTVKNLTWQYNAVMSDWGWRGGPAHAMTVRDAARLEQARVFVRGNQHDRGAEVPRKFLSALGGERFDHGSGRLELARVIADGENPLTARVMANRVWQHLFGFGIVRSASDFGTRGDAPSHPDLLDWLAATFVEDGWSVKRLIKRIVMSETYRQSSANRPSVRSKDPENKLLWRQNRRRMDFESMRDTMLAASGRLDLSTTATPFRIGARPSVPRRSVYAYISREEPSALLRSFDFSNPEQHTPERQATTVPQQALFLMNSEFVAEQARAAAELSADVTALYRRVLGRDPALGEVDMAQRFVESAQKQTPESEIGAGAWRYGFGRLDARQGSVLSFTPFRTWIDDAWQHSSLLPDPVAGTARLTAGGGAPGDDLDNVVIRRWVSPISGEVSIAGTLKHALGAQAKRFDYSNGVRGWMISSRQGKLGSWIVRGESADTKIDSIRVESGETIDFVVDSLDDYEADAFTWAPEVTAGDETWSAKEDFAGPAPRPLTAWERLAQTLLLTNELAFVD